MVKTNTMSFDLVNGELKLFISYFDIYIKFLQHFDIRFRNPSTYMNVGPSKRGKSYFIAKFLKKLDIMID